MPVPHSHWGLTSVVLLLKLLPGGLKTALGIGWLLAQHWWKLQGLGLGLLQGV